MIIKFTDFLNEKLNLNFYKPKWAVDNYIGYNFSIDDEDDVGFMEGFIENNIFWLNGIIIQDKFRNQYLGEQFIIEYLKKYGGYIGSNSKNRSKYAERMWERLIKRSDINFELDYQKGEHMNDKGKIVDKIDNIFKISLK